MPHPQLTPLMLDAKLPVAARYAAFRETVNVIPKACVDDLSLTFWKRAGGKERITRRYAKQKTGVLLHQATL